MHRSLFSEILLHYAESGNCYKLSQSAEALKNSFHGQMWFQIFILKTLIILQTKDISNKILLELTLQFEYQR